MLDKQGRFYKHMRQVHMDFHMPEFPRNAIKNFDARRFVDHLERGKVNMVALFSKCHFGNSFYNTKAGHKHAGLEADFLMETAVECRKRGIFIYAYYSLCTDVKAFLEHENWRYLKRDGTPHPVMGPWAKLCLNTPYKEELVLPQLEEIIQGYPVDALWLDIPYSGYEPCHCESCKKKFQQLYGRDIGTLSDAEGHDWNIAAMVNLIRELRVLNKKHGKNVLICTNGSGYANAPLAFTEANDILCWESQPRSNYLSHSFTARYVRTLDIPCQVMSVRFYQGWGDLTLKPAAQMTTEFAAMIGNGVAATSGDQVNVDGSLQPAVYEMFNKSFGFVEEREEILRQAHTVRETALLAPASDHHAHAPGAIAAPMRGAHKMLVESHIQHDIVNALYADCLDQYKYVVLSEPFDFNAETLVKLRGWVEAGGVLLACGTSLLHEGRFELADVFGIDYIEPCVFGVSHFKPHATVRGETDDLVLQCRTTAQKVVPTTAECLADFVYPQGESTNDRAFRNHLAAPPADESSPYPFATFNTFGKGRAVYIAGSLFDAYWTYNHHWLRQFFAAVFAYVDPHPLYTVDIPLTMETNLMRLDNGDILFNIIDYQVGHQASKDAIPAIEKVFPYHNAACRVRVANAKKVVLEPEGTELEFSQDGEYISFTVPELLIMAMVRIVC